ncbi:MAG: exopolysaccharide biosynthesis protein, partial [Paracoccaceae bacterium]
MTDKQNPLLDTIECVSDDAVGDTVKLGTMLDDVAERGYGPLVMFLSAFVILPTGMIPGVPAIIGLALLYVACPMVLGR